jgi:hypothetical protein
MPKPIELPPAVACRFVDDMRAFHAEPNAIEADEIVTRQLHALRQKSLNSMAIGSSDTVGNGDGASCGGGTAIGPFGSRVGFGARGKPFVEMRVAVGSTSVADG